MEKKNKVLLCGVCGYLGRNLCEYLLRRGDIVTGVDLQTWDGGDHKNFSFQQADLTDGTFFQHFADDYDKIFFLTGLSGTAKSFDLYENFIKVNELSLLHLLNAMRYRKMQARIIFPSTRLVYEGRPGELPEDALKQSKTVYSASKIACEAYLNAYQQAFGINYRILRICVPYGNLPGRSYSYGTIGFFLKQAQQGTITLYGDGSLRRTFTHVEDLSRQLCAVAETDRADDFVYNSCGENFSLYEAAKMIADKKKANIVFQPFPELESRLESGDTVLDGTRLQKILSPPIKHHLQDWLSEL